MPRLHVFMLLLSSAVTADDDSEFLVKITHGLIPLPATLRCLSPPVCDLSRLELTFSHAKATRLLGYEPIYSMEEGKRQAALFYGLAKPDERNGEIKASGKVKPVSQH